MAKSERLSILSDLEEFAFYGFPDFTDEQRATYFTFEEQEWNLISTCPSFHDQVYCALQIGYFKAKKLFFPLNKIPQDDIFFILSRYFQSQALSTIFPISKHEYYLQRKSICHLFGYKLWSREFSEELLHRAELSIRRDITPNFIAHELFDFLQNKKIVRPGYTTLQTLVSSALAEERHRLKLCLQQHLTKEHKQHLDQLLKNESTLSALAALKQDAKNFNFSMMKRERQKHAILKPLYDIAQEILPYLRISQQNITHYANLIHYYTIYDLDRFDAEQTYLYLLCYVFKRFQQINDNLVEAFTFQVKNLEKEVKATSILEDTQTPIEQQIGRLLLLYVDETLSDIGDMRKRAFEILPKDVIRSLGEKMVRKPQRKQNALWQARIGCKGQNKYWYGYKKHISMDMQSGMINKVAITPANVTDAQGLKHICPSQGAIYADKGYCTSPARQAAARKGCHLAAIKKNNMKDKNTDQDRWYSKIRAPYERVFASNSKRVRYKGIAKNQFAAFMQAICFNLKRLLVISAPSPIAYGG